MVRNKQLWYFFIFIFMKTNAKGDKVGEYENYLAAIVRSDLLITAMVRGQESECKAQKE